MFQRNAPCLRENSKRRDTHTMSPLATLPTHPSFLVDWNTSTNPDTPFHPPQDEDRSLLFASSLCFSFLSLLEIKGQIISSISFRFFGVDETIVAMGAGAPSKLLVATHPHSHARGVGAAMSPLGVHPKCQPRQNSVTRTDLQTLVLRQDWQRVLIRLHLYPSECQQLWNVHAYGMNLQIAPLQ